MGDIGGRSSSASSSTSESSRRKFRERSSSSKSSRGQYHERSYAEQFPVRNIIHGRSYGKPFPARYHMPSANPTAPSGIMYRRDTGNGSSPMMMMAAAALGACCCIVSTVAILVYLNVSGKEPSPIDLVEAMRREALECCDIVELQQTRGIDARLR